MTTDRIFRGFAADGSKVYEDRCTYCLMTGHRASHCPKRPEPDCARYCAGQCDPMGTGCWKHPELHQIAEPVVKVPDPEAAFMAADGRLWRSMQRIGAAAGLGALVFLIAKAMGVA